MSLRPALPLASTLTASLCLTGCFMTAPTVDVVQPTQVRPVPVAIPVPVNNGSLFQAAGYRPLYETPRARMVGDILTVNITEKLSAKQESVSSIEKKGALDASITAAPFVRADQISKLNGKASSSNKFDGTGSTEATNTFSGTITTTVVEVLPNGHLIISGEKQIGLNHNVETLKFSGQVDPINIQPGNSVSSSAIANVRVQHRGRGQQDQAQGIGWLSRFFLNISPI
jgi:flagellar L-ring protein FlgH